MNRELTMLSLFAGIAGIAGIDLAAERHGIKTVAFCEIEPYAVSVLNKRFPGVPVYGDIRTVTKERLEADGIGKIDILTGGFPCQPFSCAGKRNGQEDDRYLWPEMLRLVGELRPRWVLGENVAGLLSIADVSGRGGGTFGTILYDLASLGYRVGWSCYGVGDIGAPHQRDRVFPVEFVALNMDAGQYHYEPPRVVVGQKNRAKRLKCLGNAVSPEQIEPIFAAIAAIERQGMV